MKDVSRNKKRPRIYTINTIWIGETKQLDGRISQEKNNKNNMFLWGQKANIVTQKGHTKRIRGKRESYTHNVIKNICAMSWPPQMTLKRTIAFSCSSKSSQMHFIIFKKCGGKNNNKCIFFKKKLQRLKNK